jgi:OOP family OmpA-OmpF porin
VHYPFNILREMTKMKKYLAAAILTALAAPAISNAAQEEDTRWYVAPFGSYVKTDSERNSNDGWGGGLAVGKMLNSHFNAELKGFYQNLGSATNTLDLTADDSELAGGTADLQYFFFRDKFSPYAVVGAGAANTSVHGANAVGFLGEAGLGLTYEICEGLFLRSDVRYRYNNNFNSNLSNTASSDDFHEMVVNVGFVLPLGEKAHRPEPKIELPIAKPLAPTPVADCSTQDSDSDGVNNCLDLCSGTIAGSKVDAKGCPISLEIKGVQFEYDSAQLTPSAKSILDGVAKSLIAYPQKNDLEVQGHTSSEGTDKHNLRLSKARSQSVADYLAHKGVKNKLTAHGYGESHPVADNSTEAGRVRNRRVELIWLGN